MIIGMSSGRTSVRRHEDVDDDNSRPQAPTRDQNLKKAAAADHGDTIPKAKTKRLKKGFDMEVAKWDQGLKNPSDGDLLSQAPSTRGHPSPRKDPTGNEGDFISQAPTRDQGINKPSAGNLLPRAPMKGHPRIPDTSPRDKHGIQNVDMQGKKTVARHSAAASYPGAIAETGKEKSEDDTEPDRTTRSLVTHLDDSFAARSTSLGVLALASTSLAHSTETARAYKTHDRNPIEEETFVDWPSTRVGAVVVPGFSSSEQTSDHSASTYSESNNEVSLPPPAVGEEEPLQAMLVADRVTWANEEADVEAQVQARMRTEAEDIADMVHKRIFQNTATAVVHTGEAKSKRRKICILLVVVSLVIAGAIGAGVGIALSKPPPPPPSTPVPTSTPPDSTESFRNALVSVSGERLDDKNSPQYQALNWIANEDPAKTSVNHTDIEIIKQRYVAAVLYFALSGEGWINQYKFRSEADICSWNQEDSGIICDSTNGNIQMLNLCKSNRLIVSPC
jgi:hypothetical protein